MDIKAYMQDMGRAARLASRAVARADSKTKNLALTVMAQATSAMRPSCSPPTSKTWPLRAPPDWTRRCWIGWR